MNNDSRNIIEGDRVIAFDSDLYVDDVKTPLSMTMKPGTVVCRYGKRSEYNSNWLYPDLVDVKFDHKERVSKGHFTTGVKRGLKRGLNND